MNKKCFIIMSFKQQYDDLYTILNQVLSECGYSAFRTDDAHRPGSITDEIIKEIIKADLIIADISERSDNIFYELGVSHSVGNKTLLISNDVSDLPFDLGRDYALEYDIADQKKRKLFRYELKECIKNWEAKRAANPEDPMNIVQSSGREYFEVQKRIHSVLDELLEEREHLNYLKEYFDNKRTTDNQETIQVISQRIISLYEAKNRSVFIALSGAAGVGKSTFSNQCKSYIENNTPYSVTVCQLDAFMLDRAERMIKNISGYDVAASDLSAANNCLYNLINGNAQIINPYNHNSGKHDEAVEIMPANIIIAEGIHSLNPILLKYYDLKIFLYSSPETTSELRFLADVFERSYSPREAFKHANTEYDSFQKHILHYIKFADEIIVVKDYWKYTFTA